jgi:transposase-like protein
VPDRGDIDRLLMQLSDLTPVTVAISSLLLAGSPRGSGEDAAHCQILAHCEDELPPVIVHSPTMRVIDGVHRVRAAKLRGENRISVRFFDGDEASCFVLAVRANIAHGLPLSLADRKAAAARIIALYPQWSDRMTASVTGLSHKTVGLIRNQATGENTQLPTRKGLDGRRRPVNTATQRAAAADLLREDPTASVRQIARAVGLSPATVRDVRKRLERGEDPAPRQKTTTTERVKQASTTGPNGLTLSNGVNTATEITGGQPRSRAAVLIRDSQTGSDPSVAILEKLTRDPSIRLSQSGREILHVVRTLGTSVEQFQRLAEQIPPHWNRTISQLVKTNAARLASLAQQIEQRDK